MHHPTFILTHLEVSGSIALFPSCLPSQISSASLLLSKGSQLASSPLPNHIRSPVTLPALPTPAPNAAWGPTMGHVS